jgi:hypothetical protein
MLDHNQIVHAVALDYIGVLNRLPDVAGLNAWVGAVESGAMTLDGVVSGMAQYLDQNTWYNVGIKAGAPSTVHGNDVVTDASIGHMYAFLLGKTPDQAGHDFWLNSGVTNAQLLQVMVKQPEFIAQWGTTATQWEHDATVGLTAQDITLQAPGSFLASLTLM